MFRALIIFSIAALGALLVAVLVDNPGAVTVDWLGYRLEMAMSLMAGLLIIAFLIVLFCLRIIALVLGGPAAWRKFFGRVRAKKGMGALTQGLAAAAAGDASEARRHAITAERLAKEGPLARVLALEAAELEGRDKDVVALATGLLEHSETALLGQRALFDQARKTGNEPGAVDQAEAAFENHPAAGWAAEALLADAIESADWPRAKSIVARADRHHGFINGRSNRIRATLMMAEAVAHQAQSEHQKALGLSKKAHDLDPTFTPAPIAIAEIYGQDAKTKRAAAIVEDAWSTIPHPALGRIYAELFPSERQVETLGRLRGLISLNSRHSESRLLFAHYAIAARNFAAGRDALKGLVVGTGSARAYALMAALDRSEQGMAEASEEWMAKALAAPRDALWICTSCGHGQETWSGVCGRCRSVGTQEWASHLGPDAEDEFNSVEKDASLELEEPSNAAVEIEAAAEKQDELKQIEASSSTTEADLTPFEEGSLQPDDPGTDKPGAVKGEAAW